MVHLPLLDFPPSPFLTFLSGDYEKLYDDIPRVSIDRPRGEKVDAYILREDLPLLGQNGYSFVLILWCSVFHTKITSFFRYEILEEDREEYFRSRERQQRRSEPTTTQDWGEYHHYDDLEACLRNYTETYPNNTELFSVGQSYQGREMWGLKIASLRRLAGVVES